MVQRNGGARSAYFLPFVFLLVFIVSGCPDPFNIQDDVERDLDRPLPDVAEVEQTADPDDPDLPYNTQPVWTWNGDPQFGTDPAVFRYRLNGSGWTILVVAPEDQPPYSYNIAEELDESGNQRNLFPGTYLFEVQERNSAGNWSASAETTTTILVRPPVYTVGGVPGDFTNNAIPFFEWGQWLSTDEPPEPQYGATNTYSWRLERRNGNQWEPLEGENGGGTTAEGVISHTVSSPLADGQYRFGVAEWNQGGERSAFVPTLFTVDTVAPNAPLNTTEDVIVSNQFPTWTWATGGPDGIGTYRWWLRSDGTVPNPETDAPTGGPLAATVYTPGTALTEGTHILYVQERDAAGNWSALGAFQIIFDPNIPTFTLSGEQIGPPYHPSYVYNTNDITLTYVSSGTDQVVNTFQYSINNGASWLADIVDPLGPQTVTLPGNGTYTIRVRQKRTDETYTPASSALAVVVDTIPPGTPVVSGPGFDGTPVFTFLSNVMINVADSGGDGTVVFDVDRNNESFLPGQSAGAVGVDLVQNDTNTISVTARDLANNPSSPVTSQDITVLGGILAPTVTSPETPTLNRRPTWNWTSIENLVGNRYRYALNGGAWTETFAENFTPGFDLTTGMHTLEVQQQDDLGVWSTSTPFTVEVLGTGSVAVTITLQDPVNPTFTLPSPGTITRGTLITVNLTSTIFFDSVTWLVNGNVARTDSFTDPVTTDTLVEYPTLELPLGINRITVLVEIDSNWYSSEDMTFEVVQP